jgi:peptidoglycan-associated lipoprotein
MRSKTFFSISLLSIAALSSACSRHRVSASATPTPIPTADRAASEAAQRENARLRAESDDATSEREAAAARNKANQAGDHEAITTPVYFQFDRSDITDDGIRSLDQKVDVLQRNPNVRLRIEGNADDSGSDEYNLALSQRRAAIVTRYLTDRGIDASRLKVVAYGEERPACITSRDEDCRSKNRRDEFVVLSGF